MTTTTPVLLRKTPAEIDRQARPPVDEPTRREASKIVEAVRSGGEAAVRNCAVRFGERQAEQPLVLGRPEMHAALKALNAEDRSALERTAARIRTFAQAQRSVIAPVTIAIPGGAAGHTVEPVESAGCYSPGGRYPLPSTVLMTAITARVAGCARVVVASPGAHPVMLAAAAIAGADEFLCVGGAHAIAAMAYGFGGFARCDVIAGPGNRWVTAAKQWVNGVVGIDMLAGPSELLVLADETADAGLIAADLLAQAEHDADAVPMLVTTSGNLADAVDAELEQQLARLSTRDVAVQSLRNGFTCVVAGLDACLAVVNRVAPEHLEIMTANPDAVARRVRHAGAIFCGPRSAEVLGDYGAGPNHTLPTGGTARFQAGLSVTHFIRLRTWLRLDGTAEANELIADTMRLARIEQLAGHEESARRRGALAPCARRAGQLEA